MYQGSIFIKVSRIAVPSSTKSQPSSNGFVASASNSTANNTSNITAVPTAPTTTNSPPTKAPKPSQSLDRRNSEKLLKFDDDVAAPTKSSSAGNYIDLTARYRIACILTMKLLCIYSTAPDIFAASAAPIPASTQHSTDNDLLGLGLRSNSSDAGSIKVDTDTTTCLHPVPYCIIRHFFLFIFLSFLYSFLYKLSSKLPQQPVQISSVWKP